MHDAVAAAAEAAGADVLASRRAGDHGRAAFGSAEEDRWDADGASPPLRISGGLRRLLRSAPAGRCSSAVAADAGAYRNTFSSALPGPPRVSPMPPRRPRTAGGFLVKRNPAKPLRLGMVLPTREKAADPGGLQRCACGYRAQGHRIPSLITPASFEWRTSRLPRPSGPVRRRPA